MTKRRLYGSVRRLPSGRWQARYWADGGERLTAPTTFATRADAHQWLSAVETDMARGDWHDPRLGAVRFADWADRWLATKTPKVRSSTADL